VICRRNDVVFLAIFGSFVGDQERKESDIDIAIEFERQKSIGEATKNLSDELKNKYPDVDWRKIAAIGLGNRINRYS